MNTNIQTGLTTVEVEQSRAAHGSNQLTPPEHDPWWVQLLEKFTDPLIVILMVAAVISFIPVIFVPGHSWIESAGIVGAVFLATTVGFINEYKANKEFDILNKVNDVTPVRAIRNGQHVQIPKNELVVGDIVLLEAGEEVPADGILRKAISLRVNQSSLTGESEPVLKTQEVEAGEPEGAYALNVVLRSTMVTEGHGIMEVTAVGDRTEIGKVAKAASEDDGEKSPLNQQLEGLSKGINVAGFTIAAILFASLIAHDTILGTFVLSSAQWVVFVVILGCVGVGLLKVWYPVLQDLLSYFKVELPAPSIVEDEGLSSWVKCLGLGVLLFCIMMGGLFAVDLISSDVTSWLPAAACDKLLLYFMIAITLIVVAVPEGLPMSVTLSLAYSMRKMAKQNNLVRHMDACETIGAATVICSDKTGTLTLNRMTVKECAFPGIQKEGNKASLYPLLAEAIAVNSTADLDAEGNGLGNVTECAMLKWLRELGTDYEPIRETTPLISQLPFSTQNKLMATCVHSSVQDADVVYVKGAPEIILARCTSTVSGVLDAETRERITHDIASAQKRAMRALGLAFVKGAVPESQDILSACQEMVWLGFFAIQDPLRSDVPDAVACCHRAGVSVKIVTGDNRETACQIARESGILPGEGEIPEGAVMTGPEFGALSDEDRRAKVNDLKVLSRARPMDKLQLVEALQQNNHVVAVTGDGTNDAPALSRSDVGLSMGITGTSVAKEASDIVLLDDSFSSITRAIKWGRSLYLNIQKFIVFQLTVNVAACGIAALGPFTGVELPLTVTQMLWVNLIMDTFAALALATEPPGDDVMSKSPRDKQAFIITSSMWKWILWLGSAFILVLILYIKYITRNGEASVRDVTILFTGFVLLQFWNLFNARVYGTSHSFVRGLTKNYSFILIAVIILVGQVIAVQYAGSVFRTEPLSASDWCMLLMATSPVLLIGEAVRFVSRLHSHAR